MTQRASVICALRARPHLAVLPGTVSSALDATWDDMDLADPEVLSMERHLEARETLGTDTFADLADALERGDHLRGGDGDGGAPPTP